MGIMRGGRASFHCGVLVCRCSVVDGELEDGGVFLESEETVARRKTGEGYLLSCDEFLREFQRRGGILDWRWELCVFDVGERTH